MPFSLRRSSARHPISPASDPASALQARSERKDILPSRAAAQQHREQLGVAQSARDEFFQPFLRALTDGGGAQPVGNGIVGGSEHSHNLNRFCAAANSPCMWRVE